MRVLAVDTTTSWGSVAVVSDSGLEGEVRLAGIATHSASLLPSVEFVLGRLAIEARELDALAVVTGPGSFTGLRIGLSSVQGLALATGRPCFGISGLALCAWRLRGSAERLVSLLDAHRDEVYFAAYDRDAAALGEPDVGSLASVLAAVPAGAAYGGPDVGRLAPAIRARDPQALIPDRGPFLAASLGRWALERLGAGETGVPPAELRACYLRKARVRTG